MTDEPNWSLLPDDPRGFFELPDEFDRKALRRAYTRWIRHFKPERHPEEFKRIRAAYEALDAELRFGVRHESVGAAPVSTDSVGTAPVARGGPDVPVGRSADERRTEIAALVRTRGIGAGVEAVRSSTAAPEDDWPGAECALALLEDATSDDPGPLFDRLIAGAERPKQSETCSALLAALMREQIPPRLGARLVQRIARSAAKGGVHAMWYWYVTEPRWVDLARTVPFESFEPLFERCRRLVGDEGWQGRVVVLVRLRRLLALRASDEWLRDVDAELTDAARHMPPWIEYEFDLVQWLGHYRTIQARIVDGSTARDVLDAAISGIIELDEVEADRAFLESQIFAIDHPDEWMESLNEAGEDGPFLAGVLSWYGEEWRERRGVEAAETGPVATRRCQEFLRRLDRRSDRSILGSTRIVVFWVVMLGAPLIAAFWSHSLVPEYGSAAWAIFAVVLVVQIAALPLGWLWPVLEFVWNPLDRLQHRRLWRPMATDFMAETRIPLPALLEVMRESQSHTFEFAEDVGLLAYSEALQNVRE